MEGTGCSGHLVLRACLARVLVFTARCRAALLFPLLLCCLGSPVVAQDRLSDAVYDAAVETGQEIAKVVLDREDYRRGLFWRAIECGQGIIAEGDSWFYYPVWQDIGEQLEDLEWAVFSGAAPGDTLRDMLYNEEQRLSLNDVLYEAFTRGRNTREVDGCRHDVARVGYPKAILLSVGGNDIIDAMEFLLEHGDSSSDEAVSTQIKNGLFFRLHRTLVEYISMIQILCSHHAEMYVRTSDVVISCRNIPIFLHGYAYVEATGRGFLGSFSRVMGPLGSGPWLRPAFEGNVQVEDADRVIRELIDGYNSLLCDVAWKANETNWNNNLNPIYHLDFRELVQQDDWQDELHPNQDAARELAEFISGEVVRLHRLHNPSTEDRSTELEFCIRPAR